MNNTSSVPPILYKFLTKETCDFFDTPRLRFSPLSVLNDLFEGKNRDFFERFWEGRLTVEQADDMNTSFENNIKKSGLEEKLKKDGIDASRFEPFLAGQKSPNAFIPQNGCLIRPQDYFDKTIFNNIGVLCLSGSTNNEKHLEENILMWAHYTKNEGFAVGFDSSHQIFTRSNELVSQQLAKIVYTKERQRFLIKDEPNRYKLAEKLLFSKAQNWNYENEWRLLDENYKSYNEKNVVGLCNMPIEAIKEVILAVNCSNCLRVKAQEFCEKNNVDLYQLMLNENEYSFKKIKLYSTDNKVLSHKELIDLARLNGII